MTQEKRKTHAPAQAQQLRPRDHDQVQVIGHSRRGYQRRHHMQQHHGYGDAAGLRGPACRGGIAVLLERHDRGRCTKGVARPSLGRRGQAIQTIERGIAAPDPIPVLPPHDERAGIDDHERLAHRVRVGDDICGTTLAPRRLPIPHDQHNVGAIDGLKAAVHVGIFARARVVDDPLLLGPVQPRLHLLPLLRRKVGGEIRPWQRQQCMPGKALGLRRVDKQQVRAGGHGGERDPFAVDVGLQGVDRLADRLGGLDRPVDLPVPGEPDNVKVRQVA